MQLKNGVWHVHVFRAPYKIKAVHLSSVQLNSEFCLVQNTVAPKFFIYLIFYSVQLAIIQYNQIQYTSKYKLLKMKINKKSLSHARRL